MLSLLARSSEGSSEVHRYRREWYSDCSACWPWAQPTGASHDYHQ